MKRRKCNKGLHHDKKQKTLSSNNSPRCHHKTKNNILPIQQEQKRIDINRVCYDNLRIKRLKASTNPSANGNEGSAYTFICLRIHAVTDFQHMVHTIY